MANAKKDGNYQNSMIGISNADGLTILPVYINASNHGLKVDDNTTGTNSGARALHDSNYVPSLVALSSAGDGTKVALYVDSATNKLLIKSS